VNPHRGRTGRIASSCWVLKPRTHCSRAKLLHHGARMPRRRVGCPQVEALPRRAKVPHPNRSPSTKLDLQHDRLKRTLDAMATSRFRIHIRYGLQTRCIAPHARPPVACLHGGTNKRYPRRYTLSGIGRDGQRLKDVEVHGYRHTRTGGVRRRC